MPSCAPVHMLPRMVIALIAIGVIAFLAIDGSRVT
jgi:hypothetical protein